MQAAATLSFMADKERVLRDLSLSLPFHLIEVGVVLVLTHKRCPVSSLFLRMHEGIDASLLHVLH